MCYYMLVSSDLSPTEVRQFCVLCAHWTCTLGVVQLQQSSTANIKLTLRSFDSHQSRWPFQTRQTS